MENSTLSKVLRTALFVLVPAAYLSMRFWRPQESYGPVGHKGMPPICTVLMAAVFLLSVLSWKNHRWVAVFGLLACLLWVAVLLLPVL
jgi:hypothetical protein